MSVDSRRFTLSRSDTEATDEGMESPVDAFTPTNDDAFLVPDNVSKQQYGSLAYSENSTDRLGFVKRRMRVFYYKCYEWKVQGEANKETGKAVTILVCWLLLFIVTFNTVVVAGLQGKNGDHPALIALCVILVLAIIGCLLQISRYPQNKYGFI